MKVQKAYYIEESAYNQLERIAESQHRSPMNLASLFILERLAQCDEERRATGQTSLFKNQTKQGWVDIEDMPLDPI